MDWLTFIAQIIGHLAWPAVVVTFLVIFRDKMREVMGRVSEVLLPGGGGVKIASPSQIAEPSVPAPEEASLDKTDALPYYLRVAPDVEPYIERAEEAISKDLDSVPPEQRDKVLVRNLVFSQLRAGFEYTYNLIVGGQLRVLEKALQAGDAGLSYEEIRMEYEETLKAGRWTASDYSMLTFVGFLTNNLLLQQGADSRYRITPLGRTFLQYLTATGKSPRKVP